MEGLTSSWRHNAGENAVINSGYKCRAIGTRITLRAEYRLQADAQANILSLEPGLQIQTPVKQASSSANTSPGAISTAPRELSPPALFTSRITRSYSVASQTRHQEHKQQSASPQQAARIGATREHFFVPRVTFFDPGSIFVPPTLRVGMAKSEG